ncbi:DUF5011 domain-containing protein [Bacillus sp. FJAT-27445]|uniref:DUF5011 domain-containing protein n=1 Tax=Bacillus sp. FJAT-27445 TaxID=1679166 RepID=UPI0007431EB5|nr:DUF5011 domain-containing protein [Bacillus sp. FJAT-27445]
MRENKLVLGLMFFVSIFLFFSSSSHAAGAGSHDKQKPVLAGITHENIFIGQAFDPLAGISAKDNVDGNITRKIVVSGKVNTKKAGKYVLTYTVYDKAKNKAMAVRTITVIKDTDEPAISGLTNKSLYIGKAFDPLSNVTAMDNVDGDLTSKIIVSGLLNNNKSGKYVLTYSVSDKAGNNTSRKRIITVIDNVKPVISGTENIEILYKESFNPLKGVTAHDANDGDLTFFINVSGNVNIHKVGSYTLQYSVKDKAGNSAEHKRVITVKNGPHPTGGFLDFFKEYISPDNGMTVTVEGMIVTSKGEFNTYTVLYTQKNNTNSAIPEGFPKIYYSNDTYEIVTLGINKTLNPGESVSRGVVFKRMITSVSPLLFEYAKDSPGVKPLAGSLKWRFEKSMN